MLPATNTSSAQGIGFPDVCETPPDAEPVPYENTASTAEAEDTAEFMLLSSLPAVHTGSTVPSSEGDEAGTMSANSGEGMFLVGASNVLIEGCPAVNMTTPTLQNDDIASGSVLVPSVTNVLINLAAGSTDAIALHDELSLSRAHFREEGPTGTLVVSVDLITESSVAELRARLRSHPLDRGVVLDLRGCRGGDLDAALTLAGTLVPVGTVLARVREADGEETTRTSRGSAAAPHPMVVLVDRGTASAAEALAAALQTNDRALLVGERTYGKARIRAVPPGLATNGATRSEMAGQCRGPDGAAIEGVGIAPDIEALASDALSVALETVDTIRAGS